MARRPGGGGGGGWPPSVRSRLPPALSVCSRLRLDTAATSLAETPAMAGGSFSLTAVAARAGSAPGPLRRAATMRGGGRRAARDTNAASAGSP